MEKEETILHRTFCQKAKYKARTANGEIKEYICPTIIVCDNSLTVVDNHTGNVIWDDDNSKFVYFTLNSQGSIYNGHSNSMTFGNKPAVPLAAIVVDYGEIQNFRIELTRDAFESLVKDFTPMTEDQKNFIRDTYFNKLDMDYIIRNKRKVSYVTQQNKDSSLSQKHFDENDEYKLTVRPGSSI